MLVCTMMGSGSPRGWLIPFYMNLTCGRWTDPRHYDGCRYTQSPDGCRNLLYHCTMSITSYLNQLLEKAFFPQKKKRTCGEGLHGGEPGNVRRFHKFHSNDSKLSLGCLTSFILDTLLPKKSQLCCLCFTVCVLCL